MTLPPLWFVLPIALTVMLLQFVVIAAVMSSQGKPLPMPAWWLRVPPLRRRLAYVAIAWHFVAASLLLWSFEPGNDLPEAVRIGRVLISYTAWGVLVWVGVTAVRSTEV